MLPRPLAWLAALALPAAIGCGNAPARPVVRVPDLHRTPDRAAKATEPFTARVRNHLAWPYRLTRILLVVDREILLNHVFLEERGGKAPEERIVPITIPPGDHMLALLADAAMSATLEGPDCNFELRSVRSFRVAGGKRAEVDMDLYLRGVHHEFVERPSVAYELRGTIDVTSVAVDLPEAGLSEADRSRCAAMAREARPVCLVETRLAGTTRFEALCVREKLAAMRVFAAMRAEAENARARAAEAARHEPPRLPPPLAPEVGEAGDATPPPALDEADYRTRVDLLDARLRDLAADAERCDEGEPAPNDGSRVEAQGGCPTDALPEIDFDGPFPRRAR